MIKTRTEVIHPKILLFGPASVSLLVVTGGVTDPVNATKFFLVGGLALSMIAATFSRQILKSLWKTHKITILFLLAFLGASINSLLQSQAPISQSIYGTYGRNNGFLLYLFLTLSFIAILTVNSDKAFKNLVYSLLITGLVNIIYCLWVISFGDFLGWNNPYGNILGTFGNPNFIGAFFGMFSSLLISMIIYFRNEPIRFIPILIILILCVFEIYKSNAIQGRILFFAGCAFNAALFIWLSRKKIWTLAVTLVGTATLGILGILGALQIGPLTSLLYKDSVSLRGEYWYAGMKMGIANPLTGVGFDSYGDWYRFFRRSSSLIRPGIDTVTNTAHNVFIDIFAFGGIPLVVCYLAINVLTFISIFKVICRRGDFDFIFASMAGAWLCYQLQSVISINQVGLALWGWILGGALIAFEKSTQTSEKNFSTKSRAPERNAIVTPELRSGVGFVVGLLIAVPPLSADMKWRSAQTSQNANEVELSLKSSYMNPTNSIKLLNNVGLFHDSGLDVLAHKYSQEAVKFNPNNFELWRAVTYINQSSLEERKLALAKMRKLDPLNTNLESDFK